jgi:hypothetical protein
MKNVVFVDRFGKLDFENIEFYEDLYVVGDDKTTITFTPLGANYYGGWFRRFGFAFEAIDAYSFFTTVRDINRILWDMDSAARPAEDDKRSPEERAVWQLFDDGRFEEFTVAFVALAERSKSERSSVVVPLFGGGPSSVS